MGSNHESPSLRHHSIHTLATHPLTGGVVAPKMLLSRPAPSALIAVSGLSPLGARLRPPYRPPFTIPCPLRLRSRWCSRAAVAVSSGSIAK